jgi:hypothetical protein
MHFFAGNTENAVHFGDQQLSQIAQGINLGTQYSSQYQEFV